MPPCFRPDRAPPVPNPAQALFHFLATWRRRVAAVLALLLAQLLLAGAAQAQAGNVVADPGFNSLGTGATGGPVRAIAVQPLDGKVLVGGSFTDVSGTTRNYIARLNTDGTLDTSFDPGTGADNGVESIAVQPDGKVLVGGWFTDYNGTASNYIARLNTDGTLDPTFSPAGTGLDGLVRSIAVQPDGKVLIGGNFTDYNGTASNYIARLNTDGTLDPTFSPAGTGLDSLVLSIAVQPLDGKVLVGGWFTDYNGTTRNHIARLNTDGTLDPTFSPAGTGLNGAVRSIAVQPLDGQVLIGGYFTDYNGTTRNHIARLNTDGTLDTTFSPAGTGLNGWVYPIAVQPLDGKVLIGGDFTDYNGITRRRIARLNTDGTLDPTFSPAGTGLDGLVLSIAVQPDGKVLIGGYFTEFNGTPRNHIARLAFELTATASVASGNGSISPASYNATTGSLASFTLTPSAGYEVDTVTGTCGGTLSGNVFTTDALTTDCTVTASFSRLPVPTLGPWALLGLLGAIGLWSGRRLRRA